jgi:acetyl esterase/lipase
MQTLRICFALFFAVSLTANAQEVINLYPGAIPNSKKSDVKEVDSPNGIISGVTIPTLQMFLPEKGKSTGVAVVICPGGAYAVIVYQPEGVRTAKEFARNGVAAFVLKYRLPSDSTMVDKKIGPLQDAQQAIKVVRDSAAKWGIDPNKVGIMGFSAGGHLASTEATHHRKALIQNDDNTNLRPDFQIEVYPVISMLDSLTHLPSRTNLVGKDPPKEVIDEFSSELQVDGTTPPAYITQAGDDTTVDVDNSIVYYEALRHHKVAAELHLYPHGGHGFVLFQKTEDWMAPIFRWMRNSGWINN